MQIRDYTGKGDWTVEAGMKYGLGDGWADARSRVDEANPYVMRYVNYFERFSV